MRIALGLAATALLLSTPAFAADQRDSALTAQSQNEMICKNAGPRGGSLLNHRKICMKRVEWQMVTQNDREEVELAQLRSLQVPMR